GHRFHFRRVEILVFDILDGHADRDAALKNALDTETLQGGNVDIHSPVGQIDASDDLGCRPYRMEVLRGRVFGVSRFRHDEAEKTVRVHGLFNRVRVRGGRQHHGGEEAGKYRFPVKGEYEQPHGQYLIGRDDLIVTHFFSVVAST